MGSSEGDPPPLVSGRLSVGGGVSSRSSPSLQSPTPVMLGTGDGDHLGEVRPHTFQSCPVSRHGDQHLSGEGVSVRLSSESVVRACGQFSCASISSSKDVAVGVGPHGVAEEVCSPRPLSDAPISVAPQKLLVSNDGRSFSASASVSRVHGVCLCVCVWGGGGMPAFFCRFSLHPFCTQMLLYWAGGPLTASRVWSQEDVAP